MKHKILIAEDSPSALKLIQMSFPATEFEIYAFRDGQEAWDSLSQLSPDAILLNLSLPGKDGYELGERIKNQEGLGKVPLFLIKEAFEPLDKERLEALAFEAIVQKPFDSDALVQRIRTVIEERRIPPTLPEEPVWQEEPASEMKVELDQKVRELVRQEILSAERESEKRVRARLLAELKMWLLDGQKK